FFLREVYLKGESDKIYIVPILQTYQAEDHEQWLEKNQTGLPVGTMLITGLSSFVHCAPQADVFRLKRLANSLDPHWKLFKEYGTLSYLPLPEPARLWRLS